MSRKWWAQPYLVGGRTAGHPSGPPPKSGRTTPPIGPDRPPNRAGHASGPPRNRAGPPPQSGPATLAKVAGPKGPNRFLTGSGPCLPAARPAGRTGSNWGRPVCGRRRAGRPAVAAGGPAAWREGPARPRFKACCVVAAAAAWRLRPCSDPMQPPTAGMRASARVLTRRRSDLRAGSRPGRASASIRRILPRAPPERLLPPSAPRRRAPSACGACRRRWLGCNHYTRPSRSTLLEHALPHALQRGMAATL